jgi:hypothetical protein
MDKNHDYLKPLQVSLSHKYDRNLKLRTHRALSWLQRAEKEVTDDDARFIFLWISFNALYGRDIPGKKHEGERVLYRKFLKGLVVFDKDNDLRELVFQTQRGRISYLIENKYVYTPFWDDVAGLDSGKDWEERFQAEKKNSHGFVESDDLQGFLEVLMSRLYELRNQLVHGSSTWDGSVNRDTVIHATEILGVLVPAYIYIILHKPDYDWGEPKYKVVDNDPYAE